jgi:DNA polymerase-3 subunit epsilon
MKPELLQFAIVDIETNGGPPNGQNITEVAAILHDGSKEMDRWVHLFHPGASIPSGITRLTGIDDSMVADAPPFSERAEELISFLGDAVFVAHNVGFDLRYLQAAFKASGHHYNPRRLCTVRMSRKWIKGPQRYSLGALCAYFDIENEAHHRAWGDAAATAILFSRLWSLHAEQIKEEIGRGDGRSWWPPHLPPDALADVPTTAGVYHFLDEHGRIAYIGMSRNLSSRIRQHFNNSSQPARAQLLRRTVHKVSWEETGSELMALILEDVLIRRHHPPLNSAQKSVGKGWSIERFTCRKGIKKAHVVKGGSATSLRKFRSRSDAEQWLRQAAVQHGLNPTWSGLPGTAWAEGWVDNVASRQLHNLRMDEWDQALRLSREAQMSREILTLPQTPQGGVPEILLSLGRFQAYRFRKGNTEAEWQYDTGSGRIDAALERHFLESPEC